MATHTEPAAGSQLLVVIDHQEAKVYRSDVPGAAPERLEPSDPAAHPRDIHPDEWANDRRQPKWRNFYAAIAKTVGGASQILLFGSGTGKSSAMEQLLADLKDRHPDVAAKVIGSVVVDVQHSTENQLLAKAREFYAAHDQR